MLVGAVVAGLATMHLLDWDTARWASRVDLCLCLCLCPCLGPFLVAAPALLGYTTDPELRHAGADDLATGAVVVAGALLRLAGSSDR